MSVHPFSSLKTGHVGLNVTDLERSREFYTRLFGFEVVAQSETPEREFAFLGQNGELVLTLWRQAQGAFATNRPGLHHLSFEVASLDEVHRAESKLRDLGATIHHDGVVAHSEGAASGGLFFEDPDGTRLEIYAASGAEALTAPSQDAPTCGFF